MINSWCTYIFQRFDLFFPLFLIHFILSNTRTGFLNSPTWLLGAPATIRFRLLDAISALVGLTSSSPSTTPTLTAPADPQAVPVRAGLHQDCNVTAGNVEEVELKHLSGTETAVWFVTYGSMPRDVRQSQSSRSFSETKQSFRKVFFVVLFCFGNNEFPGFFLFLVTCINC